MSCILHVYTLDHYAIIITVHDMSKEGVNEYTDLYVTWAVSCIVATSLNQHYANDNKSHAIPLIIIVNSVYNGFMQHTIMQ